MRRLRIAAFAAGGHCPGAHLLAELDDGDETVAVRAIELFIIRPPGDSERGERAPVSGGEPDRDARRGVVERLHDISREPLKPIDLAPRRAPFSEIGFKTRGGA